jgi:hypothetical protein
MLSDDPTTAASPTAGEADGLVPFAGADGAGAAHGDDDDDADTFPMPVILPGSTATPRPGTVPAQHRGPFEPAQPSQQGSRREPESPGKPEPADSLSPAAAAKLDQIKDLLITAEAIGEQNLNQHFDQVRQRQRELIREFFDEARPDSDTLA